MSRAELLDWLASDDECVIQDARNELSIKPDADDVREWLDGNGQGKMTSKQLQQLSALVAAATPGTWWINRYATDMSGTEQAISVCSEEGMTLMYMGIDDVATPDASFVCAARQAVPELLAYVADLRRQLEEAQAEIAAVPWSDIRTTIDDGFERGDASLWPVYDRVEEWLDMNQLSDESCATIHRETGEGE